MKQNVKIWVSVLVAPLLNESKRLQRVNGRDERLWHFSGLELVFFGQVHEGVTRAGASFCLRPFSWSSALVALVHQVSSFKDDRAPLGMSEQYAAFLG